MSAITVIYNLNQRPVQEVEMEAALDRLKHRGDDGKSIWIEDNIGMGHRMRWTTPESLHEKLPLRNLPAQTVITSDARIDNRDELIPQLDFAGKTLPEITDSEIILKAYEKWGDDCLPKLIGDYVFAIWDARQKRLICARDSMGVKHFYYYFKPGEIFALASEIKALLSVPGVPKELNETNLGDLLILNYQDKENTPYRDIKRLPANNSLILDQSSGISIRQYWRPKPVKRFHFKTSKAFEEKFLEIFTEAVVCRLRSHYPVGSMLSGGLDSSSISAVAGQYMKKEGKVPFETFSAVFPAIAKIDSSIDERHYINSVVNHVNCRSNLVEADNFSPFKDLSQIQWHADHPVGAPNVFMDWALFEAAQKRNVRVLLSGFDGDSTVSYGYEALSTLARRGNWIRLTKDALALNKNMPGRHHTFKNLIWNKGFAIATPDFVRQIWRIARGRSKNKVEEATLPFAHRFNYGSIKSNFAEEKKLKSRYFELIKRNHPEGVNFAEEYWNALCNGLFAFALETFEKLGAATAVEPRFPFFDRRLIEFCIGLPPQQRLYQGWTRSIIRRAMKGILPPDVQWRTDKANIGLSFKVNMLKYGKSEVERTLSEYPEAMNTFFDHEVLVNAFRKYQNDPLKNDGEAMVTLSSVYLANWLAAFAGETGLI